MRLAVFLGFVTVGLSASDARGYSLFPAGTSAKSAGMETALVRDAQGAVFYNPAALSLKSTHGTAAELGFIAVSYAYEHPNFDPVIVKVNSPTASVAYAATLGSGFAFGLGLFPTKNGTTRVPGVPRRIGDTMYSVDVKQKETAIRGGAGLSYNLHPRLAIGISVVLAMESLSTDARLVQSSANLIEADQRGVFLLPKLGMQGHVSRVSFAASVNPAVTKRFNGSINASTQATDENMVQYEPAGLQAAASWQVSDWSIGLHNNVKFWREGRTIMRAGNGTDGNRVDLKTVWERSVHLSARLHPTWKATGAYAQLPSQWGDGYASSENANRVDGVDFGQADGIDREVMALGSEFAPHKNWRFDASLSHAFGKRNVEAGGENEGYYQVAYTLLNLGVRAQL